MTPEIIAVACMSVVVLAAVGMCAYVLHRAMEMTRDVKKDYVELLSQTIDNLKAQSLQERVEAKTLEKESDVRIEMLKDAMKAEKDAAGVEDEPKMATTTDGTVVDLRDYEII